MHIFVCVNKCSCGLSSQSLCLCVRLCTEASIERRTARYNPAWMIGPVSIATGQRKAERRARPLCQCSVGKIITRRLWMHVVPLRTQLLPWIGRETIAPIVSLHAFLLLRLQQYLCIRRATPDFAILSIQALSVTLPSWNREQRGWDPIRTNFVWSFTLVLVVFYLAVVSNLGYFNIYCCWRCCNLLLNATFKLCWNCLCEVVKCR